MKATAKWRKHWHAEMKFAAVCLSTRWLEHARKAVLLLVLVNCHFWVI